MFFPSNQLGKCSGANCGVECRIKLLILPGRVSWTKNDDLWKKKKKTYALINSKHATQTRHVTRTSRDEPQAAQVYDTYEIKVVTGAVIYVGVTIGTSLRGWHKTLGRERENGDGLKRPSGREEESSLPFPHLCLQNRREWNVAVLCHAVGVHNTYLREWRPTRPLATLRKILWSLIVTCERLRGNAGLETRLTLWAILRGKLCIRFQAPGLPNTVQSQKQEFWCKVYMKYFIYELRL